MKKISTKFSFLLFAISVFLLNVAVVAQKDNDPVSSSQDHSMNAPGGNPAAKIEQARNGKADLPISPANWVNGNIGGSTAHFAEGHSIPYRVIMTNLPIPAIFPPVIFLTFEFDAMQGGKHAIDFITSYDNILPHDMFPGPHNAEIIDPTIGTQFFNNPAGENPPDDMALIPQPGNFYNASETVNGLQQPQTVFNEYLANGLEYMSLWGGTFSGSGVFYTSQADLTSDNSSTQVTVSFHPTSSTCILAWGGHLAMQDTWGEGNSAIDINGSPYHTRLITWNIPGNNIGQQDLSCNSDAIYVEEEGTKSGKIEGNNSGNEQTISLNAYPNPVSENLTINVRFSQATEGSIDIYNSLGNNVCRVAKNIFEKDTKYSYTWRPSPALPQGIYVVKVSAGGGSQHFRIALIK